MGGPMAANLAKAGLGPSVFDKAGTEERAPPGSLTAASAAVIAGTCVAIFLSLPAGPDVLAVLGEIIAAKPRGAQRRPGSAISMRR
jgi:3-hydroxyisobutyrate dehydrogenase-like beta-hydroxyacid dehydrogenase